MKSKEEKQSFISKFIETATLKKDKDGNFDIDKINFRSRFVEQIDKLYDKGVVDFPTMLERGGKLEDTRISVNMNNEQLQDYLSTLEKELDINYMDLKNKLRLGVCMSSSAYTNLKYNKAHIYNIFDKKLKEIENDYLVSYINMRKYPTILFVMAKIMEMNSTEQNQIAMYLYNNI